MGQMPRRTGSDWGNRGERPIPRLVTTVTEQAHDGGQSDVEFFGVKLKVANPRLVTLLNSSVNENVVVIGRRTVDLLARADEDTAPEGLEGAAAGADRP